MTPADIVKKMKEIEWQEYDLHSDLYIDKYSLDDMCVQQPMIIAKWAMALSHASTERDKAKERLKATEASLLLRGQTECTGKKTDTGIKAWVKDHIEYKQAVDLLNEAESNVNYLFAAKSATEAKKNAIELIGKLYLSGYYSEPSISDKVEQKTEQVRKQNDSDKITKALKNRKIKKINI
jgi:hypothetical protein